VEPGVVTDDHVVEKVQREVRIAAFLESVDVDFDKGLSFEENMRHFLTKNRPIKEVEELVWRLIAKD
jgi:hypothetical protein